MSKKGAERQVKQQLVHQGIIQFEDGEDNDSGGIFYHSLTVVKEFACDGQQGEVVCPRVHEKLYGRPVDAKGECFQEGDEGVYKLFVVKVELERNELVEEGVWQDIV